MRTAQLFLKAGFVIAISAAALAGPKTAHAAGHAGPCYASECWACNDQTPQCPTQEEMDAICQALCNSLAACTECSDEPDGCPFTDKIGFECAALR